MKSILLAAAALALATSASAYVFAPGHQTFTLNGTVTVEGSEICTMNAAGYTHGDAGMITAISMSSDNFRFCANMVPLHLPWKIEVSDTGQPIIRHMRFFVEYLGIPHARYQAANVDQHGAWTFVPSGEIQMTGTVQSTPPIATKP